MKATSLINELQSMVNQAGDAEIQMAIYLGGVRVNVGFDVKAVKRQFYIDAKKGKDSFISIEGQ